MGKILMKGNEAIAESAVRAGGLLYFGYPITPQSEIAEYLAHRMPEVGGVFLQIESEVAVANVLYGAAGAGARAWTSSSSPGISLMMEGRFVYCRFRTALRDCQYCPVRTRAGRNSAFPG
jgi:2-oxoglutarate ferredoxin oxidoreductase subunit alpha